MFIVDSEFSELMNLVTLDAGTGKYLVTVSDHAFTLRCNRTQLVSMRDVVISIFEESFLPGFPSL
jgi:hypothetical protein